MDEIRDLLVSMIRGFVSCPDDVDTWLSEDQDARGKIVMINVKVAKEDVGTCIGEKGATAEAIRKVIGLVGFKQLGERVYVKIDAPKIPKNHFDY